MADEPRTLQPFKFLNGPEGGDHIFTDFTPRTERLDVTPPPVAPPLPTDIEPDPSELEAIAAVGLDEPTVDGDQLALVFDEAVSEAAEAEAAAQAAAVTEDAVDPPDPVLEDVNKGKVPPA